MNKRLLVLVALAAAVWGGVLLWPQERKDKPAPDPLWPTPVAAKVARVAFAGAADPVNATALSFSLVAEKGAWFADIPGRTLKPRVDSTKVEALLRFIEQNKPKRRLGPTTQAERGEFGLDKSTRGLSLEGEPAWTLSLGGKNPSADGVYAVSSLEANQTLILDAKYEEQLGRKPEYFFDTRVFETSAADMVRVRLDGPSGEGWELARNGTAYSFAWPDSAKDLAVSSTEAEAYCRALTALKAGAFVPEAGADAAPPEVRVTVWKKQGGEPEVLTLAPHGQGYLGRSAWLRTSFEAPKTMVAGVQRSIFSLRERGIAAFDVGSMKRQRLAREADGNATGVAEIVAVKDKTAWKDELGNDLKEMDMLLWKLTDLKYEDEPTSTLPVGASRRLTWDLESGSGGPKRAYAFYIDPALPKGQCWVEDIAAKKFYPARDQVLIELLAKFTPAPAPAAAPGK